MEGLWALTKSSCGAGRGEGLVCLILFIYRPPPQLSVARADRPQRSHAWKRRDDSQSRAWQTKQPSVTSQLNIALQKREKNAIGKLRLSRSHFMVLTRILKWVKRKSVVLFILVYLCLVHHIWTEYDRE